MIRASAEALFRLTQDHDRRLDWDPFSRRSYIPGVSKHAAPGVRSVVVSRFGLRMETEYVTVAPPHLVAMKMISGPRFFTTFAGSWRFEPKAPGITRAIFRYSMACRPRWLEPIVATVFRRETRLRLEGLKRTMESA